MDKKVKSLFIATPQWLPLNPPFSLVPIVSYLRQFNYDTKIFDFNIDYYLEILNENYLNNSIVNAKNQMNNLFDYLKSNFDKNKTQDNYSSEFKSKLLKYNKIKEFTTIKYDEVNQAIGNIEHSLNVMRDEKLFYNPKELTLAMKNIDFCLEIASLPYFPSQIQIGNYTDPFFKLDFDNMLKNAKSKNMFTTFYEHNFFKIIDFNPDIIGISINSTSQIVSALTLAVMLKEKNVAKVIIGGNFFSRVTDAVKKYPDFFKYFCDYLMGEEGEIPTLKLLQHLDGELNIEDVPNILYLKVDKVVSNGIIAPLNLNEHPVSDLSDFDLKKYLTPYIVLPQQSSRGCYWGKCSFCDHDFGQKINVKKVSKFIDELEILNKKYGIKNFELIDECISPKYLLNMSKEIIKRKLNINWFNNARLETAFNEEVLTTAYKAGLKMLLWGFESGSKKIMEYINKGIDIEKREDILRLARKIGIWNFAFIFFGFPSETEKDAIETIEYIKNHTDIISSYGRSIFSLGKHTTLRETPEKFSITKIYPDIEEFSPSYHFETSVGMNEKEINEIAQKCLNECNKAYKNPIWMYLIHREILFLYIAEFGADKVEKMSIIFQSGEY